MTSREIRQKFLDHFARHGHTIVPSAPMVIKDDPTLMFTNAGMNQFKDLFLGNREAKHTRIADTQKCLRVSARSPGRARVDLPSTSPHLAPPTRGPCARRGASRPSPARRPGTCPMRQVSDPSAGYPAGRPGDKTTRPRGAPTRAASTVQVRAWWIAWRFA